MPREVRQRQLQPFETACAGAAVLMLGLFMGQLLIQSAPAQNLQVKQPQGIVQTDEVEVVEEEEPLHDDSLSPFKFDALDERTPYDPEVIRGLNEIDEFIAREEWPEVVESLQTLIDRPETLLMPCEDGRWRPLQDVVAERIQALPPEGLRVYHQYFDAEAERLWAEARQEADIARCGELSARFPLTPGGLQAANYIGLRLFDEGDYAGAAMWFQRVWLARPNWTDDLAWRQRAAFALLQAGQGEQASEMFSPDESAPPLVNPTQPMTAVDWLDSTQPLEFGSPALSDWRQWHGDEAHRGTATEGRPVLLREWHVPSTSRHLLQIELDRLDSELARHQQATVPAWPVVAVNGLAVSRTFRGIQVIETATGRLLWETDEATSPERVLSGDLTESNVDPYSRAFGFAQMSYNSGSGDSSPLATFVYRDLVSGLLGTDGEQLFVLEDNSGQMQQPNPYMGWGMPSDEDLYGRDWSTNRLVSYDLRTGRRLWAVGGTKNDEPFDPHLAGSFFLGVPVCSGDELYVVAERDRTIELLALNADTGQTLWSCELLTTGSSVSQDVVRRLWACQPAVCGSMIVCPTGLGWVMGIDRWQHSIVWAHRLSPRVDGSSRNIYRQAVQQMHSLGSRWFMAPPVISGHRVLLTPVEVPDEFGIGSQPTLVCLDAYTGEVEWEQPRDEYLQLSAVVGETALLVGSRSVAGLSVESGEAVWCTQLEEGALPSGQGIVSGGRFLLPISEGRLWSFDLASGEIIDRQASVIEGDRIGNVAIHDGLMLSSTPDGLSAYPLETRLQSWINERLAADPNDPQAALRLAEMSLVSGDYERALELLPAAGRWSGDPDEETDESLERARTLRRQLLVKIVEEDLAGRDAEFAELAALSVNDEERIEILKIEADRNMARGQWSAALDVYQSLLDLAGERMVFDGPVEIRLDRLVSARMEDLWTSATPEIQLAISEHLQEVVAAANQGDAAVRDQIIDLFGFHPATAPLIHRRAEDAGDAGRLVEAEILWNRLRDSDDPLIAADATWRYIELLAQFGLYDDIRHIAADIPAAQGESPVEGETTLNDRVSELLGSLSTQESPELWNLDGPRDWSIRSMGWQNYQNKQALMMGGNLLPSMSVLELSFLQNGAQRLQFLNTADNESWGTPVATNFNGGNYYSYFPGLYAEGHAVYSAFQEVVSCISYFETEVCWATPTATSEPTQMQRYARGFSPSPLFSPENFRESGIARMFQPSGGLIADANPFGVLCYGDEELVLIDPLNGEVQWRLPGVPAAATAYLFGREIYLIDERGGVSFVVRVQDARQLDATQYVPGDELQRAAFERAGSTSATETSDASTPVRGQRQALPLRRALPVLPRPAESLTSVTIEGATAESAPTRVVSHWGDGLFAVVSHRFVRIDYDDETLWLTAIEPDTGDEAWALTFPAQVRISITRDQLLFVLSQTDGRAWLIDLRDGSSRDLDPVPEELHSDATAYVVADSRFIFLIVNHLENPQSNYNNLQSVQVHGTIVCWSRDSGDGLWQQTIENQQLVLNSFEETPVLVLTAMQHVQNPVISYMEARVQLIDKQSGYIGLEDKWASVGGSVNQFIVDPSRRFLELRTYNDRVRMTPIIPDEVSDASD